MLSLQDLLIPGRLCCLKDERLHRRLMRSEVKSNFLQQQ